VTQLPVKGAIHVRQGDAHAWTEVWLDDLGWVPYDPTPRILRAWNWSNYFRTSYDTMSAYWYRYVLGFSAASTAPRENSTMTYSPEAGDSGLQTFEKSARESLANHLMMILVGFVVFAVLVISLYLIIRWRVPWVFSIRYRVREGQAEIKRERLRMERILRKKGYFSGEETLKSSLERMIVAEESGVSVFLKWIACYERARFGEVTDKKLMEDLKSLRKLSHEIDLRDAG
jgi:hypothetical protein